MERKHVSMAEITQYLGGINFPCSKDELVKHAREKNAPQDIINTLERLPAQRFHSMTDVTESVGRVE